MDSSLQTPALRDYMLFTFYSPKNIQERRPDLSEATFCVNYDLSNTSLILPGILYLPERNLNFSKNIPQCTIISPAPIYGQQLKAADDNARELKNIYSRMKITSGSVLQQQPRSLMIEQCYREFCRSSPLGKTQCQLPKQTLVVSPP